jgi:ArsR family transcriptional regulator, arsenate/arsenite/antimonite-responsive transcriptional repressor
MKAQLDLLPRESLAASDEATAAQLAALAHPVRLQILRELCAGGQCCKEVVGQFSLAQSTISQHLRVLVSAGLLTVHYKAQRSHYGVNHETLAALSKNISQLAQNCRADAGACHPQSKDI